MKRGASWRKTGGKSQSFFAIFLLLSDTAAREACLSPFHFHRLFLSTFGETAHDFLTRLAAMSCDDGDSGAYFGSFSLSLDLFSSRKARRLSAWSSKRVHCSK